MERMTMSMKMKMRRRRRRRRTGMPRSRQALPETVLACRLVHESEVVARTPLHAEREKEELQRKTRCFDEIGPFPLSNGCQRLNQGKHTGRE